MNLLKILFSVLILILITACSNSVAPKEDSIIYFNSFESQADIEEWFGLSENNLKIDCPSGGGKKSALISGGCIIPHSRYNLRNESEAGKFIIECWGKTIPNSFGGEIIIKTETNSANLIIKDSVWTYYKSDTLNLISHESIIIEMNSGGFIAAGMLVDNVLIRKIE